MNDAAARRLLADDPIGRTRTELPTPALVLDVDVMRQNIATMAAWNRDHVAVRPHFKTHKCIEIAREQVASGAIGVTCATVWEAAALVEGGLDEILIANEVVGPAKISLLGSLARDAGITVAVDDADNAATLAGVARDNGAQLGAIVEVDVGLHRGGVRSVDDAIRLARHVGSLDGLQLRGVMGYEGHVVTEPDAAVRRRRAGVAMDELAVFVDALRADGQPIEIVSAGGTNTFDMTGADRRVTELQAGTYVVMDGAYAPLAPSFRPALTIMATVVSRQRGTAVLDCGTKSLAIDAAPPTPPTGSVREVHEEHTLLDAGEGEPPAVGDVLELIVGYAGGTINLHDVYFVASGDQVVDIWQIRGRGPGWTSGLARRPVTVNS
jgi:D-serine deaminase-like pyridoxal phosphate-dependent protein